MRPSLSAPFTWRTLAPAALLIALLAVLLFGPGPEGNVSAQTQNCAIALTVTSPANHVINGEWTTSDCPTIRAQYEWRMTSELTWRGSHWTTARNGEPNRFVMKDLPPGAYEFRIATDDSSFHRVAIVSTSGPDRTYGAGDVIRVGITWASEVTVTGTPRLKIKMDPKLR